MSFVPIILLFVVFVATSNLYGWSLNRDEIAINALIDRCTQYTENRNCMGMIKCVSPLGETRDWTRTEMLARCENHMKDDYFLKVTLLLLRTARTIKPSFNDSKTVATIDLRGLELPDEKVVFVKIAVEWYMK